MSGEIHKLTVPKWGLTMERGTLAAWNRQPGDRVETGDEVCDLETEKIMGGIESPVSGILRRQVASVGDVLPIGALLGVIADESVSDAEIDAFIADFKADIAAESDADDGTPPPAPEHIEVAGRRVRHLAQPGQGTPIVLVHGFGGNLENWILNQAALAAGGHPVAALDLPGHGESLKTLDDGSLGELASSVMAYMDFMGFKEAHLVGHSMGSAVCLMVQRQAPSRVKSLSLIAPAGVGQAVNNAYIQGFTNAQTRRELKPVLEQLFAEPGFVSRQLVDDTLKYKRLEGMTAALSAIAERSLGHAGAALPELATQVPLIMIWGAADQVIPPPNPAQWAQTDVEFHLLEGMGHMVQVEAAAEVNRRIIDFLSRQQAS
ncbi:acetoin dehydrogenase dihydrolipoyllysine-residue acetyltransferase subunit [Ottowia sp.]|uniref:acetoin dehydrogenase dihydrolipoyllysine-residue acetyltransferase subunit n=1 Tax=Ottowia sp. TaxID=1898956 RepID=UPI003A86A535